MKIRFLIAAMLLAAPASAADNVTTYHNSNQRDGAYVVPGLTLGAAANVVPDTKFKATVSGHVYAQPLFWKPKSAKRGLVVVATESNNVYALDEASGKVVWQTLIGNPMPLNQLPCGNIDPMGVTGTPVIDPTSATLYFDAMTKTSNRERCGSRAELLGIGLGAPSSRAGARVHRGSAGFDSGRTDRLAGRSGGGGSVR